MVALQEPSLLAASAPLAPSITVPSWVERPQVTAERFSPTAPQPTPETVTDWPGA